MLEKIRSKKHLYLFILAVSSGILLSLGWYLGGFMLFVGFVPLLEMDSFLKPKTFKRTKFVFFLYLYLALLLWNVLTTWWVINSTIAGAISAFVLNSLFMTIPFLLFRSIKLSINDVYGYFSLILYWLSFEYLHHNWDLSWPWLTLGNAFATLPSWVQWYEYTGVLGGSLWVLLMNIYIFLAIRSYFSVNRKVFKIYAVLIFLIIYLTSLMLYYQYEDKGKTVEIVVAQPNIDPYNEKFSDGKNHIPPAQQLERLLRLSEDKLSPKTQMLVFPEVAITNYSGAYSEEQLRQNPQSLPNFKRLLEFQEKYPKLSITTGLSTYIVYPSQAEAPTYARVNGKMYYDVFNTAMLIDESQNIEFYHKSKPVPGVENIPFPSLFADLILDFGGARGLMIPQKERSVFRSENKTNFAPMICYESIYGAFATGYIDNKANILCVITNDAWWGNTPGHQQHFNYARLRAIETRKSICRSANTGISGFINQRGDIVQASKYWTQDAIKGKLKANDKITFYTQYKDYLGRLAWFLAVALFLTGIIKNKVSPKKNKVQ